ncbi:MAG: tRNA pseudouridine(38-40) synthase TruA [Bacteroidales bacterium]|nr:MAG: tRNA pseudouridine(38-40) synthase TruA [Bacteroidales bacterium]
MRYFLYLSYKGTNYSGWQIQPNAMTVQEMIEKAMAVVLRERVPIAGAGRTDTGVHAKEMVAHFDLHRDIDIEKLPFRLNSFLPKDIAINKIVAVKDDAHARFSAISRSYEYYLYFDKNPFLQELAYRHHQRLDFDLMNLAANKMIGRHDFTSFSKLHTSNKTNICKIEQAIWQKKYGCWVFSIKANRFLRDMVRATVGTLLLVGQGRISIDDFCQIMAAKDRRKAGSSVAADGLYLVDIEYPDDIFIL